MQEHKIGIIGLGYVGLPLAVLFAKKYSVIGYDTIESRVRELKNGVDRTKEVEVEELKTVLMESSSILDISNKGLYVTSNHRDLSNVNTFIITVPTPITEDKKPDLSMIESACQTISKYLKKDDIVILESTVYPGVTEEFCAPILEKLSGLRYNEDFFMGYSPERVNPGDKVHRIENIIKVTSGSTAETANRVDSLYKSVITAGTHKASHIKVAEAAKAIENAQRDINIAFMNELKQIFDLMDIETSEVLSAARTKWNFLDFHPGLVGGHCIGVDPYYLTHKAKQLGYDSKVILSGREINDSMADYHGLKIIANLKANNYEPSNSKILILGASFKPNVPDIRNSKALELVEYLLSEGCLIEVCDPLVEDQLKNVLNYSQIVNLNEIVNLQYDCCVRVVNHEIFKDIQIPSNLEYNI